MISGLGTDSYAVSENGRYIAWQDEPESSAEPMRIMDLEREEIRTIEKNGREYFKPVGFVESDFVYGTAKQEDVATDAAGNSRFPMYKVILQYNLSGNLYLKLSFYLCISVRKYKLHLGLLLFCHYRIYSDQAGRF